MILYLAILFFLLSGIALGVENSTLTVKGIVKRRHISVFLLLAFALLLFFYSVRGDSVGWDTNNYFLYFNNLDTFGFNSYLEKGWVLLMYMIHSVTSHHIFYFFVIGGIGIGCYFFAVKRLSLNVFFSLSLYFMQGMWFNLMNQQRNAMAACICMVGFCFLVKKKYVQAMMITLIAYFIHDSAFVFALFIIYDYLFCKNKRRAYTIFFAGTTFVTAFYWPIYIALVTRLYPNYLIKPELIKETRGGNYKMLIFYVTILLIAYYIDKCSPVFEINNFHCNNRFLKNDSEIIREKYLMYLAMLFACFFQIISINNTMIGRFSNYFNVYMTILIPNIIQKISSKKLRVQYTILVLLLYFAYMLIYLMFSENGYGHDKVLPYVFAWQFVGSR